MDMAEDDVHSIFGGKLLGTSGDDDAELRTGSDAGTSGFEHASQLLEEECHEQEAEPDAKKAKIEFEFIGEPTAGHVDSFATGSSDPLDATVGHALIKSTDTKQFRYPWERGYLNKFFSGGSLPGLEPPSIAPGNRNLISLVVEADEESVKPASLKFRLQSTSSSITELVVRKTDSMAFMDEKRKKREDVVAMWRELLSDNMDASAVGRKISVEAPFEDFVGYAHSVVDASFAVKSANTLQKRYYALKAYRDWCMVHGQLTWIPQRERDAWDYVKWLDNHSAAPTKASSFVEACRFAWYILGVSGADGVEHSLRIRGLTAQLHCRKRPWRPADVLSTGEVTILHEVLASESRPLADRVVCGHMLHVLYSRSRWSDMANVRNLFVDADQQYVELDSLSHKGARNADSKSKLLPIVCPCRGIIEQPWLPIYLDVRLQCGLDAPDDSGGPMLQAPLDPDGLIWAQRCMTSSEGTAFRC